MEVDFLFECYKNGVLSQDDLDKLLEDKESNLRKVMLLRNIANNRNMPNTNVLDEEYVINECKINYRYQRYDLIIDMPYFMDVFYDDPKYKEDTEVNYYFANSGMCVISTLLLALKELKIGIKCNNRDLYFETFLMIEKINKNSPKKKVYYLDSIAMKLEEINKISFRKYIAIIVDTTCLLPGENKKLVDFILKNNCACIMIRSHNKLDMLGSDYARLGSVVYIVPNNVKSKIKKSIKLIMKQQKFFLGKVGGNIDPLCIPPFWKVDGFKKASLQRNLKLRNNNIKMHKKINVPNIETYLPPHCFFLLIKRNDFSLETSKRMVCKLISIAEEKGLPVSKTGSFGMDQTLVDCYRDTVTSSVFIRVAVGNYSTEMVELFVKCLGASCIIKNIENPKKEG